MKEEFTIELTEQDPVIKFKQPLPVIQLDQTRDQTSSKRPESKMSGDFPPNPTTSFSSAKSFLELNSEPTIYKIEKNWS